MANNAATIWESFYETVKKLPQKEQSGLALAMLDYAFTGEHGELSVIQDIAITPMKASLNTRNMGGAPRGNNNRKKSTVDITVESKNNQPLKQPLNQKSVQQQEQEQEQEQEHNTLSSLRSERDTVVPDKIKKSTLEIWNLLAERYGLTKITSVTNTRLAHVNARTKQNPNFWITVGNEISESEFLRGHNDRGFKADFDWVTNESNFCKIAEGKYRDKVAPPPVSKMMKSAIANDKFFREQESKGVPNETVRI